MLELRQKGVSSLPALAQQWHRDPAYLKSAVEMWIKLGSKQGFEKAWLIATKSAVAALSAAAATAAAAKAAAAAAAATPAAGAALAADAAGAVVSVGGREGKTPAAPGPATTPTGKKRAERGLPRKRKKKEA